jgi:hypothetical protein
MSELWGQFGLDVTQDVEPIVPFFAIDRESEEDMLEWLKNALQACYQDSSERVRLQQSMLLAYKGYYDPFFVDRSDSLRDREHSVSGALITRKPKRMSVNHLRDLVEQCVSRITSLPLAIQPYPGTNESADKNGSVIVKQVLDTLRYQNNMKAKFRKIVRRAIVLGEGYIMPWWNPNKGPVDPKYRKAMEEGRQIPRKDREGKTIYSEEGNPVFIQAPVHIGDVDYDTPYPWDVYIIPTFMSDGMGHGMFRRRYMHIEEVKARYPDKADQILATPDLNYYNFDVLDFIRVRDHVLLVEFYYPRNQFLPEGWCAKFTPDLILESGPSQYPWQIDSEFGDMPFERLTGHDVDGEVYGAPNIADIAALQHCYNQLTTIIRRNIYIGSTPKVFAQKGTVNKQAWLNMPSFMEYAGGVAPTLQTFATVPADVFNFRQMIRGEMEQLMGIFGASRGDPPPNTRSAEQLAFYEEQQQQRASGPFGKYAEFVIATDKKTLSIVADNYEADDGRMRLILGEDQEPMLRPYNVKVLNQPWNIRLQAVSSLSTSPTIRLEQLLKTRREFPNLLTEEQFADIAQFGNADKVYTVARAAIMAAQAENQMFAEGDEVKPPQSYQEHIVHWKEHVKLMQLASFELWEEKKQKALKEHVQGHEYEMYQLMQKNPAFAQELLTLKGFPAFFVMPEEPPPQEAGIPSPQIPMIPGIPGGELPPDMLPPGIEMPGEGSAENMVPQ